MSFRRVINTVWILAAAVGAGSVRADGECFAGYRDTTPSERTTMTAVLETAKAALPAAPTGWVILGDDAVSVPRSLCRDVEQRPWQYTFTRYYQRVDDQDARQAAIATAANAMAADLARKQPQLDALMAKMSALSAQVGPAAQAGDFAKVDALNHEIDAITKQYQALLDSGDAAARNDALAKAASADLEMSIFVSVNPTFTTPGSDAAAFPVPAGAQSAHRWTTTRGDVGEDNVFVLLGRWGPQSDGGAPPLPRPGATPAAAHALSVRVVADASRIVATTDAIRFDSLASLLK
jgi:hypothetical protein